MQSRSWSHQAEVWDLWVPSPCLMHDNASVISLFKWVYCKFSFVQAGSISMQIDSGQLGINLSRCFTTYSSCIISQPSLKWVNLVVSAKTELNLTILTKSFYMSTILRKRLTVQTVILTLLCCHAPTLQPHRHNHRWYWTTPGWMSKWLDNFEKWRIVARELWEEVSKTALLSSELQLSHVEGRDSCEEEAGLVCRWQCFRFFVGLCAQIFSFNQGSCG